MKQIKSLFWRVRGMVAAVCAGFTEEDITVRKCVRVVIKREWKLESIWGLGFILL